jgi:hypothetical protein
MRGCLFGLRFRCRLLFHLYGNYCCQRNINPVYNAPSAGDFISIYPNPSNGKLNIRSAISLTGVSFEVVDVLGKKIESGKAEDIVKVNILNDGVYFITLRNKEGAVISRKKIIVEK